MTRKEKRIMVTDLRIGDYVDLEADKFADPKHDNPFLECEYAIVESVERETLNCVAVGFQGFDVVGFPPDHAVMVSKRGRQ